MDKHEIMLLQKLLNGFSLFNADVKFESHLKPYLYAIRNNKLLEVSFENAQGIILKKSEKKHFVDGAILKEIKSVSLGYSGGSQGVSIRITKGVYYRVGAT